MKRNGRQHGSVRCYEISLPLLPRERYRKMVDSASSAAGLFIRVPNKPTNQSKYTGKCRNARCYGHHLHPVSKSKDKTKGNMKFRSMDHEFELAKHSFGSSATRVLAYLADDGGYDDDYDYDYDYEERYGYGYGYGYEDHDDGTHDDDLRVGFAIATTAEKYGDDGDDDDDDAMSFCDVGLCWGHDDGDEYDDDGWYMVGEQIY